MTDMFDPPRKVKLKSSDIREAMAKRWTAPEWAIMYEVGEGTGAQSGRYADAVMMSLWPSRGLELHGVEIKISRSDWKREAADPSKAEAIAQYCDRWWIHTPPGIIDDLSDLPPAWGLREFNGKRWNTIREAEQTEAKQITRPFLAALLRRADGTMKATIQEATRDAQRAAYEESEKRRQKYNEDVARAAERRTADLSERLEDIEAFEKTFGQSIRHWSTDFGALGAAARALADCKGGYGPLAKRLRAAADEIDAFTALLENGGNA